MTPPVKIGQFDPDLVTSTLNAVHTACDRWMPRGHFHTLGASAYLDDIGDYIAAANAQRQWMLDTFKDAYDVIGTALSGVVPERNLTTVLQPFAAAPGFHIFEHDAMGYEPSKHLDLPFQRVLWPEPFSNPFTFTVLLEQPEAGAGSDWWATLDSHDPTRVIYELGAIYIHDGLTPHAIAPLLIENGEYRITLQGHGAYMMHSDVLAVYF